MQKHPQNETLILNTVSTGAQYYCSVMYSMFPAICCIIQCTRNMPLNHTSTTIFYLLTYCNVLNLTLLFQLVYEFKDGGNSFHVITRYPDNILQRKRETFRLIGANIPTMRCVVVASHFYHVCIVLPLVSFTSIKCFTCSAQLQ